ncbi:hypothetical protein [Paraburkholderia graminis]|uniref:Uncharacterized protein n=1 Tax=Paraburkholderia graminis TaxID=60548 RepID=A0ABD5CSM9_9BURK|nr:hypothetical protein [Paraburkholderia graminis]MDR6208149.1 hypothetical protein [Paraburkholderia graminis]
MRFIPTVYSDTMGSLPRSDPRAKADFVAQHVRHGWTESDATFRYELWAAGRIEANPELDGPKTLTDEWIVQRFIRLARPGEDEDLYEPWPGYSDGMTKAVALKALDECQRRWPDYEFRAHRVRIHEKIAADAIARARRPSDER